MNISDILRRSLDFYLLNCRLRWSTIQKTRMLGRISSTNIEVMSSISRWIKLIQNDDKALFRFNCWSLTVFFFFTFLGFPFPFSCMDLVKYNYFSIKVSHFQGCLTISKFGFHISALKSVYKLSDYWFLLILILTWFDDLLKA